MATSTSGKLQDAASANGDGEDLDVDGYETGTFQVTANPLSATITFQATGTGGTFYPIECTKLEDGTTVTSTTVAGLFRFNCKGIKAVKAPITNYVAGTITVTVNAIQAS